MNGESERYRYAMENYDDFRTGTDPNSWTIKRTGYVIVADTKGVASAASTQYQLIEGVDKTTEPTEQYRLVFIDEDQSLGVFEVIS